MNNLAESIARIFIGIVAGSIVLSVVGWLIVVVEMFGG